MICNALFLPIVDLTTEPAKEPQRTQRKKERRCYQIYMMTLIISRR